MSQAFWLWVRQTLGLNTICLPNKLENRCLSFSFSFSYLEGVGCPAGAGILTPVLPGLCCPCPWRAIGKWTSAYFHGCINSVILVYPKHMQIIKSHFVSSPDGNFFNGKGMNSLQAPEIFLISASLCYYNHYTYKKRSLNLKFVLSHSLCVCVCFFR